MECVYAAAAAMRYMRTISINIIYVYSSVGKHTCARACTVCILGRRIYVVSHMPVVVVAAGRRPSSTASRVACSADVSNRLPCAESTVAAAAAAVAVTTAPIEWAEHVSPGHWRPRPGLAFECDAPQAATAAAYGPDVGIKHGPAVWVVLVKFIVQFNRRLRVRVRRIVARDLWTHGAPPPWSIVLVNRRGPGAHAIGARTRGC